MKEFKQIKGMGFVVRTAGNMDGETIVYIRTSGKRIEKLSEMLAGYGYKYQTGRRMRKANIVVTFKDNGCFNWVEL